MDVLIRLGLEPGQGAVGRGAEPGRVLCSE